ncbi:MAG: hypothetical protein QW353_05725 [Candidatus Korarchaeum sp.]
MLKITVSGERALIEVGKDLSAFELGRPAAEEDIVETLHRGLLASWVSSMETLVDSNVYVYGALRDSAYRMRPENFLKRSKCVTITLISTRSFGLSMSFWDVRMC